LKKEMRRTEAGGKGVKKKQKGVQCSKIVGGKERKKKQ
jgi:hypothetical protein